MKKLFGGVAILFALATSLISCENETSLENGIHPGDTTAITGGIFSAVIGGNPFTSDGSGTKTLGTIAINSSVSADGRKISFIVKDSGVHNYKLTNSQVNSLIYGNTTLGMQFATNTSADTAKAQGTLKITAIDTINKRISGNFVVKVYRAANDSSIKITNGVFTSIPYTN